MYIYICICKLCMVHSSTSIQQKHFLISNFSSSAQNHTDSLFSNKEQKKVGLLHKNMHWCHTCWPPSCYRHRLPDTKRGFKSKSQRSMNVYSLFSLKSSISLFLHQHSDVNKFPTNRRIFCSAFLFSFLM